MGRLSPGRKLPPRTTPHPRIITPLVRDLLVLVSVLGSGFCLLAGLFSYLAARGMSREHPGFYGYAACAFCLPWQSVSPAAVDQG